MVWLVMSSVSLMTVPVPFASCDQGNHAASQFDCLKKWMVTLTMPFGIRWHWYQWHDMTQKVTLHIIMIVLTWKMQWLYWWCHQHPVMPTLASVTSHDQESHVALHFNCCDLRNAMVVLMMLLVLFSAGANGVTCMLSSNDFFLFLSLNTLTSFFFLSRSIFLIFCFKTFDFLY